jgi:hypothetical protein
MTQSETRVLASEALFTTTFILLKGDELIRAYKIISHNGHS